MAITADAASLLFRATGDVSDVKKKFSDLKNQILGDAAVIEAQGSSNFSKLSGSVVNDLTTIGDKGKGVFSGLISSMGGSEAAAASLAGAVPVVGIALAGAGVAALGLTAKLFDLTKQAAEYGSEIHDAGEKTGLSATTISALKFAADESGSSLSDLTQGLALFSRTVGLAADGSALATAKIKALGIEPKDAINDLQGSLEKVFKTIYEAKPGIEQTTLAQKAFGRSGADLIPVINQMHGDLTGLIAEAERLGITITDKDAAAADEFGDKLDDLSKQLTGVKITIGNELMPVFLDFAKQFSDFLANNKGEVQSWAEFVKKQLQSVMLDLRKEANDFGALADIIGGVFDGSTLGEIGQRLQKRTVTGTAIDLGIQNLAQGKPENYNLKPEEDEFANRQNLPFAPKGLGDEEAKKAAEKRAKEREDIAKRDAAAQVSILKNQLSETEKDFKESYDRLKAAYGENGDKDAFLGAYNQALEIRNKAVNEILPSLSAAERKAAQESGKTAKEIELLDQEQEKRAEDVRDKFISIYNDKNKTLAEADKKAAKESIENLVARLDREVELQEAANQTILAQAKLNVNQRIITDFTYADLAGALDLKVLNMKLSNLQAELNARKKAGQDTADIENKIAVLRENINTKEIQNLDELIKKNKELRDSLQEVIQKEQERFDLMKTQQEAEGAGQLDSEKPLPPGVAGGQGLLGGLEGALGVALPSVLDKTGKQVQSSGEFIKSVWGDVTNSVLNGIGQMVDGLGQLLSQWITTGKFSGKAALQMASQIALGLAMQAGVKAIFELAEGWAASAAAAAMWWNPPVAAAYAAAAGLHFAAAGIYGTVAGVAAGVGVAAGLGARALKDNTSGAYGSAGSTAQSRSSGGGSGGQGSAYSSSGDDVKIIDSSSTVPMNRNLGVVTVQIHSNDSHIVQVLKDDVNKNGSIRTLIRDTASTG